MGKHKKEIVAPHIDREKIREKCIELCLDLDLARSLLYGKPDKNLRRLTRKVVRGEIGAPRMDAMIRLAGRSGYELNATREGEAWRLQDRKDAERLMLRMDEVACTVYRRCAMRVIAGSGISVKAFRSYTDKDKSLPRLDRLLILAELLGYSFSWYDAMNWRRVDEAYFRWAHATELYRKSERKRTERTRKT